MNDMQEVTSRGCAAQNMRISDILDLKEMNCIKLHSFNRHFYSKRLTNEEHVRGECGVLALGYF